MSSISMILKTYRKQKSMTQQEVADAAGINLRHYQMFESGTRDLLNASFRVAYAVCKALDVPIELMDNNLAQVFTDLAIQESECKHLHLPFSLDRLSENTETPIREPAE